MSGKLNLSQQFESLVRSPGIESAAKGQDDARGGLFLLVIVAALLLTGVILMLRAPNP